MLTLDRKAQPLALREDRSVQPALLGGFLFVGLELVPFTAPGPVTPLRVVGALLLLALAVVFIDLGRAKVRSLPLPTRPGVNALRLELSGVELLCARGRPCAFYSGGCSALSALAAESVASCS